MDSKIIMPWEERPEGCSDVMWRYSKNPVIGRYHIPSSNSIFNSAVVLFGDGFAGVFSFLRPAGTEKPSGRQSSS